MSIASIIRDYAFSKEEIRALAKKSLSPSDQELLDAIDNVQKKGFSLIAQNDLLVSQALTKKIWSIQNALSTLIARYVSQVVGATSIQDRGTKLHVRAVLTFYSNPDFEYYTLWLDTTELGVIILAKKSHYVFVERLTSYGRDEFRGIGTSLMRVAYERSVAFGFKGCLELETKNDAPGFYRTIGLTTRNQENDRAIDLLLQHGKQYHYRPNTSVYVARMYLDAEGRNHIQQQMPVLY